ncbi:hypothetical protein JOD54_002121 [Actinokineospora baliensis]|nr:hypothetical protein [Actinokineospora baliensis]
MPPQPTEAHRAHPASSPLRPTLPPPDHRSQKQARHPARRADPLGRPPLPGSRWCHPNSPSRPTQTQPAESTPPARPLDTRKSLVPPQLTESAHPNPARRVHPAGPATGHSEVAGATPTHRVGPPKPSPPSPPRRPGHWTLGSRWCHPNSPSQPTQTQPTEPTPPARPPPLGVAGANPAHRVGPPKPSPPSQPTQLGHRSRKSLVPTARWGGPVLCGVAAVVASPRCRAMLFGPCFCGPATAVVGAPRKTGPPHRACTQIADPVQCRRRADDPMQCRRRAEDHLTQDPPNTQPTEAAPPNQATQTAPVDTQSRCG